MRKISIPKTENKETLRKSIEILSETIKSMDVSIVKIEINKKENMGHIFYEFINV